MEENAKKNFHRNDERNVETCKLFLKKIKTCLFKYSTTITINKIYIYKLFINLLIYINYILSTQGDCRENSIELYFNVC